MLLPVGMGRLCLQDYSRANLGGLNLDCKERQQGQQGAPKRLTSATEVLRECKEGKVRGQLFRGDTAMRT
jgi:hypothetical protein